MNRPKLPANSRHSNAPSVFRIIGGNWRSRKFHFPDSPNIRPTPDRVRETVFNWLSNEVENDFSSVKCLDLFCGSGALGLEALSRGAKSCIFVDADRQAITSITQHLTALKCLDGKTLVTKLPLGLAQLNTPFNLVFLDPPYDLECIHECVKNLMMLNLLDENALVYIECSGKKPLPTLPKALHLHRHKMAGQVQYSLWQFHPQASLLEEVPL